MYLFTYLFIYVLIYFPFGIFQYDAHEKDKDKIIERTLEIANIVNSVGTFAWS